MWLAALPSEPARCDMESCVTLPLLLPLLPLPLPTWCLSDMPSCPVCPWVPHTSADNSASLAEALRNIMLSRRDQVRDVLGTGALSPALYVATARQLATQVKASIRVLSARAAPCAIPVGACHSASAATLQQLALSISSCLQPPAGELPAGGHHTRRAGATRGHVIALCDKRCKTELSRALSCFADCCCRCCHGYRRRRRRCCRTPFLGSRRRSCPNDCCRCRRHPGLAAPTSKPILPCSLRASLARGSTLSSCGASPRTRLSGQPLHR